MSQYFPKPYEPFGGDINVKVDLSNYATESDLKNVSHVNVSSFALKPYLASLKTEVDKLDIDKLIPVVNDLPKLSNVVRMMLLKRRILYEKDGSDLEDKINKLDKKIPDVSGLVKKTDFNSEISEVEGKIPSISGLATNSKLTAVENKIPDVNGFIKKTDYNTIISEIEKKITDHDHDKYITSPEFNTLAASVFNAKIAQANLVTKTDFDAKLKRISDRVTSNASKHLLVENELKKLKTLNLSYILGKNYFEGNDGAQNTVVFQTMLKHFKSFNGNQIDKWRSKGLSNQYLNLAGTVGNMVLSEPIKPIHIILRGKGLLYQKNNDIITGGPMINIYIVYKTTPKTISSNFV